VKKGSQKGAEKSSYKKEGSCQESGEEEGKEKVTVPKDSDSISLGLQGTGLSRLTIPRR
jgi:hypothetical protein